MGWVWLLTFIGLVYDAKVNNTTGPAIGAVRKHGRYASAGLSLGNSIGPVTLVTLVILLGINAVTLETGLFAFFAIIGLLIQCVAILLYAAFAALLPAASFALGAGSMVLGALRGDHGISPLLEWAISLVPGHGDWLGIVFQILMLIISFIAFLFRERIGAGPYSG